MSLVQDVRYAARTIRGSPAFAAMAIAAIALGIGANTAIFSILNGVVLRPLPFEEPQRLVLVDETSAERGSREWLASSYQDFLAWRSQNTTIERMAAFYDVAYDLSGTAEPERVSSAIVSPGLFELLGVRAMLGRGFVADEERPGTRVVVIGYPLWQRRFGGDSSVIGRSVILDGVGHTLVGVMPAEFKFPEYAELWTPMALAPDALPRDRRFLAAVARLRSGVTLQQARHDLNAISLRLAKEFPETNTGVTATVVPLHEALRGDIGLPTVVFQIVTVFVLLIACANVAGLLLARAVSRRKEMAIRAALGAGRARIVRQLIVEGALLAVAGGALGAVLGVWARSGLVASVPIELPFWMRFDLDWRVVVFVVLVSSASVLAFALVPALQASRLELQEVLKDGGTRGAAAPGRQRLQRTLVVLEVALSLVLLITAGLMTKSFLRLQAVNPGFDSGQVLTMRLMLSSGAYRGDREKTNTFWEEALTRVSAVPGVRQTALVSGVPLTGGSARERVEAEGRPAARSNEAPTSVRVIASPGYFDVMRIPMQAGRRFEDGDRLNTAPVAIVSASLATLLWPRQSPIGRRLRVGTGANAGPWLTVVGIAGDVRDARFNRTADPTLYRPLGQAPVLSLSLVVGTNGPPAAAAPAVRRAIWDVNPALPIDQVRTMEEVVARATWQPRIFAWLLGLFAAGALLLAAVGVYGVVAYSVRQRTQEIGIRMALGARPWHVRALVVGQALALAAAGSAIAVLGAVVLTRVLTSLLFEVSATDPLIFIGAPLVMALMAVLASYLPARTATRIDPIQALRDH